MQDSKINTAVIGASPTSIADAYHGLDSVGGTPIIDTDKPKSKVEDLNAYQGLDDAPNYEYLKFAPEISDNEGLVHKDVSEYTPYITNVMDHAQLDYQRAINQSTGEQVALGLGNLIVNIPAGILENIGYTGTLFTEFGDERDYTNALTELAQKARNPFGEIYREDPTETFDLGDPAWWIDHGSNLLESIGEFAFTGYGTGKVLGGVTGGIGKALANSAKMGKYANEIMRAAQLTAQLGTSFDLAYLEGAMSGAQIYKEAIANGLSKEKAADAAARTVHWNTMVVGMLNMSSVAPLFQKHNALDYARNIGLDKLSAKGLTIDQLDNFIPQISSKSLKSVLGLEALQEGIEEDVNLIAEYLGRSKAGLTPDGENELDGAINSVISEEGALNFILGAVGGIGQTGVTQYAPLHKRYDRNGAIIGRESAADRDARLEEEKANKYINDLRSDLQALTSYQDDLKKATVEYHLSKNDEDRLAAEKNMNELKSRMFGMNTYRSILNGTGEFLKGTFRSIGETDNTKLLTDEIDEQLAELQKQQPTEETQEEERKAKIAELQETRKSLAGKTQAMVAGLTDHIENESDLNDPTYYKNISQQRLADIDQLQNDYNEIYSKFSFNQDEELAGVPDYIFQKHVFNHVAQRNLDDYSNTVNNIESQIRRAQERSGVTSTATEYALLAAKIDGIKKAQTKLKRQRSNMRKKLATQNGRDQVRKELGFTGKRLTLKQVNNYFDKLLSKNNEALTESQDQFKSIKEGFEGSDQEFATRLLSNEAEQTELAAHHSRIQTMTDELAESNAQLEQLKTPKSRKELIDRWRETKKNIQEQIFETRKKELLNKIKEGSISEEAARRQYSDLGDQVIDDIIDRGTTVNKQDVNRANSDNATNIVQDEVNSDPIVTPESEVPAQEPAEPTPVAEEKEEVIPDKPKPDNNKKFSVQEKIKNVNDQLTKLEEQKENVESALTDLNNNTVNNQKLGDLYDNNLESVMTTVKATMLDDNKDPESPLNKDELDALYERNLQKYNDQFDSILPNFTTDRQKMSDQIDEYNKEITKLKAKREILLGLLPKVDENKEVEPENIYDEPSIQSTHEETLIPTEVEVVEGQTYVYLPEMVDIQPETDAAIYTPDSSTQKILSTLINDVNEGTSVTISFETEDGEPNNRPIKIDVGEGDKAVRIGYLQERDQVHGKVPEHLSTRGLESGIKYGDSTADYWTTKLSEQVEILGQKPAGILLLQTLKDFMRGGVLYDSSEFNVLKSQLKPFYNVGRSDNNLLTEDIAIEFAMRHIGNVIFFGESYDTAASYDIDHIKKNLASWSSKIYTDHIGAKNIQKRLLATNQPITTNVGRLSTGNPFYTDIDSNISDVTDKGINNIVLAKSDVNGIGEYAFSNLETGEIINVDSDRKTGYTGQIYTFIEGINGGVIPVPLNTGTIGNASKTVNRVMLPQVREALLEAARNMASDISYIEAAEALAMRTLINPSTNYSVTPEGKDITFTSFINGIPQSVKLFANFADNLAIQIGEKGRLISEKKSPAAFQAEVERAVNGLKRNIRIDKETGTFAQTTRLDHEGNELSEKDYKRYLIESNGLTTNLGKVDLGGGRSTNVVPNTGRALDQKTPFTLHINNPTENVVQVETKSEKERVEEYVQTLSKDPVLTNLAGAIGDVKFIYDPNNKAFENRPNALAGSSETTGNIYLTDAFVNLDPKEQVTNLTHEMIHTIIQRKGRDSENYFNLTRLLNKFIDTTLTDEFINNQSQEDIPVLKDLQSIVKDDPEEMLTYGLTDPRVIKILANTESSAVTRKSYWDMIKTYIKGILQDLGIVDGNKLQELSNLLDGFISDDLPNIDDQKVEQPESTGDETLDKLLSFGDNNIDTVAKLSQALGESVLDEVNLPERSTETTPYHIGIFKNTAEELHSYNIIRNILLTEMDNIKDISVGEALRDRSLQLKTIVITSMRNNVVDLYQNKALSDDQVNFNLQVLEELNRDDSDLWTRVKAYMFRVDGIRITDAQELLEGKDLTQEEITQIAGHWDDTEQFKIHVKDTVSNRIKNVFNTTLKINPDAVVFKEDDNIDLPSYIQANVERTTASGLAEAITWSEYSNYMINIMSGSVDIDDMMTRLYTVASHNPTLLPLFYRVNNSDALRKEWYRNFKNQSPVATMGIWSKTGLNNYEFRPSVANRDSFIEYSIADDYQNNIIAKLKEGSYNLDKSFLDDKLTIDKLKTLNSDNLREVAETTSKLFNQLGIDLKPIAVEYEIRKQPVDNWLRHFRSVFGKRISTIGNSIGKDIEALRKDPEAPITFKNFGDVLDIARTMRLFRLDVGEASYINANGDLVYSHQKTSFYTDWFDKLKNPKKAEQLLRMYASVPKNQHSNWLWNTSTDANNPNGFADFTLDEDGNKVFDKPNKKFIENSRHGLHNGHKNLSLNKANEYKDMTPNDWAMQDLAYFLNSPETTGLANKVEYINKSVADAGHTVSYTGVKIPLTATDIDNIGTPEFRNSNIYQALYNIFLQEYAETKMAVAHKDQGGLQLFDLDQNLNVRTDDDGAPIVNPDLVFEDLQLNKDYINSYKNKDGKRIEGKFVVYPNDAPANLAGRPTGNIFKFLNMETTINGKQVYLHDFVKNVKSTDTDGNIILEDLISNGVVAKQLSPALKGKVQEFIDNFAKEFTETEYERFKPVEAQFDNITDRNNQKLTKGYGTNSNSAFKHAVSEYTLNAFIKNIEEAEFWGGDSREYKGAIDANKRYGQTIKNGHVSANDGNFTAITIADRYLSSPVLKQMEQAVGKDGVKAYKGINTADAQAYITWSEFKRRINNFGLWDEAKSVIEAIEDESKPFNPHDHAYKLQSLKYFLYNRDFDPKLGRMRSDQLKNSIHILIPRYIKNTQLETLNNFMEENNINQVNFESAVKVGTKTVLKIHEDNGDLKDLNSIKDEILAGVQTYENAALRIQLDVPNHIFDAENKLGIQIAKVIFNNLNLTGDYSVQLEDGSYQDIKGETLRNEFYDLYTANIYNSLVQLSRSLGKNIQGDAAYNPANYGTEIYEGESLRQALENYLLESGADNNILYAITKDEAYAEALEQLNVTKVPATQIPIFATSYIDKIISVLGSKFTNQIIDQKFPGSHCAIVSNAFMERESGVGEEDAITGVKYTDEFLAKVATGKRTHRLQNETYVEGGKTVTKAEVLLTPWIKEFYQDGQLIDINELPEVVRTQLGYRIPTEDKHSMVVFEVVGFIENGSSAIVLPDEMTVRSGLDFDIDSEYMMQYNLRRVNGKWELVQYFEKDSDENFETYLRTVAKDSFKELNTNYYNRLNELYTGRNELIDTAKDIQYQLRELNLIEVFTPDTINSVYNQINIITNVQNELITRNATDQEIENEIKALTNNKFNSFDEALFELRLLGNKLEQELESVESRRNELRSKLEKDDDTYKELSKSEFLKAKEQIKTAYSDTFIQIDNLNKAKDEIINNLKNDHIDNYRSLSREEQNPLAARQNRMLSLMNSILQSKQHYEELIAPSDTAHIYSAQEEVEQYFATGKRDLNFNRPSDLATLRQLNLSVRELKGNSVAFDGVMAIYQAAGIRLNKNLGITIRYDDLTSDEINWYKTEYPDNTKVNKDGSIDVTYTNFLKTDIGNLKNVYGENLTAQIAEVTPAILDAVKAPMSRNMNTRTLSIYRLFSALGVTHKVNGEANSHAYATAMIEQPIIYKLIQEQINRNGLLYEGRSVDQAEGDIKLDLFRDIYVTSRQTLMSESSIEIDKTIKQAMDLLAEEGKKSTKFSVVQEMMNRRKDLVPQIELYNQELNEANRSLVKRFAKKGLKDNEAKALAKLLNDAVDNNASLRPSYATLTLATKAFAPKDVSSLSYKDLINNIKYDATDFGTNPKRDLEFQIGQLNILNQWSKLEAASGAVTQSIATYNADKRPTGPEIEVIEKLFNNIDRSAIDKRSIKAQIARIINANKRLDDNAKKARLEDVDEVLNAEELQDILDLCVEYDVEPSNLMIGSDSATIAIYPSYFGVQRESAYKPLDSYLKYGQEPAYRLLSNISFAHRDIVIEHRADVFDALGLDDDPKTIKSYNRFMMNYPILNMPIIKRLYRNDKAELKSLLGVADEQLRLHQFQDTPFNELATKLTDDQFEQLSIVDKIRVIAESDEYRNVIDSYGDSHILKLISFQNDARQIKNNGFTKLLLSTKGKDLNIISDSIQAMYNSENAKLRNLSESLTQYAFMIDGFGFTYKGLGKVIPAPVLVNLGYSELLRTFESKPIGILNEVYDIRESFVKANWNNPSIAPKVAAEETVKLNKQGAISIDFKNLTPATVTKAYVTMDAEIVDPETNRKIKRTTLYKRYRPNGDEPGISVNADGENVGVIYYYPISKLMANEVGSESVLTQNNILPSDLPIFDESVYTNSLDKIIAKRAGRTVSENAIQRIDKSETDVIEGMNLETGNSSFISNIEDVIDKTTATINFGVGSTLNNQAKTFTKPNAHFAIDLAKDGVENVKAIQKVLEGNDSIYITGANIAQLTELNPNLTQDMLDGNMEQFTSAIAQIINLTEKTIYTTGDSGMDEAFGKAFAKFNAKVIVQHPKGNLKHNEDGFVGKVNSQTDRFKFAETLNTDTNVADPIGERDDISKEEKAQRRLDFITKTIAESKQVSKIFANIGGTSYAKEAERLTREYSNIVYNDLVANDMNTHREALAIMAKNSRSTLDMITPRVKVYENSTFAKIIESQPMRTAFTNMMKYAQTFIKTFEGIDELEPLSGENLTDVEQQVNDLIAELKDYATEAEQLHSMWGRILRRFQEARINQITTNPHIKDKLISVWDSRDDLNIAQFGLDSVAETGDTFVDNYVKILLLNESAKADEVRESTDEFRNEFQKWYGDLYTTFAGKQEITNRTRKDIAKKFFNTFVDDRTGNLITKYDYATYQEDFTKAYQSYLAAKSKGGVDAQKGRLIFNKWVKDNSTNDAMYQGQRVENLVKNARNKMTSAQFQQFLKHRNFKLIGDNYVYVRPSDKYLNKRYAEMFNPDGSTKNADGEFLAYLTNKIEETLSFDGAPTVFEGFLPNIPDHDRTNMQSLANFFGVNKLTQSTSEFAGVGNEEVLFLNLPFLAKIVNPDKKAIIDIRTDVSPDVELARINESGYDFKSLDEVKEYNDNIRKVDKEYSVSHKEFDIIRVMDAFISGTTDYKYKTQIEKEMLLFKDQIDDLDFNIKKRRSYLEKTGLSQLTGTKQFASSKGADSRLKKRVESFMKGYFYGIPADDGDWSRVMKALMQITSSRSMWFNVTSGIGNVAKGRTDILQEAGAGQFIDRNALLEADKSYFRFAAPDAYANGAIDKSDTKDGAILKQLDVVELHDERAIIMNPKVKNLMDSLLVKTDSFYLFMNATEHYMQNVMLLAMTKSHRVVDGKIVSLDQFTGDVRERALLDVLTPEQKAEYQRFLSQRQAQLRDKKIDIYKLKGETIPDFILKSETLDDDTRKTLKETLKEREDISKEEFNKYTTLYDTFTFENGKLNYNLSNDEVNNFKRKVISVNHSMHGIYNKFDQGHIQNSVWGQMLLQFRKWIRPNWNRFYGARYGKSQWSEGLQTEKKGAYISWAQFLMRPTKGHNIIKPSPEDKTSWNAIKNIIHDYGQFVRNARLHYRSLSKTDRANIARVNAQMLTFAAMATLLAGLGALKDKDDDLSDNYAFSATVFQLNRLYLELTEFAPIVGWVSQLNRTLEYPAAGEKALLDIFKFLQNLFMYPFRDEEERKYQNGRKYGRDKLYDSLIQNAPIVSQIDKLANIEDYVAYYKMYRLF